MSLPRTLTAAVTKSCRPLLFGLCASVSLAGAALAQQAPVPNPFEAELMQAAPELFGFLKTNFPSEFQDLVVNAQMTHASGGDLSGLVQGHLLQLRKSYAAKVAVASDATLAALGDATISLTNAVLEGEGELACANYSVNGPAVFDGTPAAAKYEDLLLAQIVHVLVAARDGITAPTARQDASDADWQTLIDHMIALGMSNEALAGLAQQDPTNPALCGTMISLFQAMASEPTGAGARVRAQFFSQVAAL